MNRLRETRDLPLPDGCRVRLVDLPVSAGGMISVDEEGFVNIYLNARLSLDAQRKALQHELRHYYRGDLYSDRDIREVERDADAPALTAIDGTPLEGAPGAFDAEALVPLGRGLYLPTGEDRARAGKILEGLRSALLEACGIYDVMQTPPHIPSGKLAALAGALGPEDIAFVAWQSAPDVYRPVLHFSRENLYGAVYLSDGGAPDDALAVMIVGDMRVVVDVRRRNGALAVCGIEREIGQRRERVY